MSQLDSMLTELKKTLSNDVNTKTAAIGSQMSSADASALMKTQTAALKDFLKSNVSTVAAGVPQESEDPQVILSRRNALSSFVGVPLKNNGKAILSGTITMEAAIPAANNGHDPHKNGGHKRSEAKHEVKTENAAPIPPMAPAPQVVLKYVEAPCKKCEENAQKEKEAAKNGGSAGTNNSGKSAAMPAGSSAAGALPLGGSASATVPVGGSTSMSGPPGGSSSSSVPTGSALTGQAAMAMPAPSAGTDSPSGMGNMGFSKPVTARSEDEDKKSTESEDRKTDERKSGKESAKDSKSEKKGFGLFNVFGGKKEKQEEHKDDRKEESESAPTSPAIAAAPAKPSVFGSNANAANQVAWFKHIQAIESALRIGDILFADSLLSLLVEVAHSVTAPGNIKARLDSMQARIHIDRKFYSEAEELLQKTIKNAEGTPLEENIAIAYCWHALAQCYHAQRKIPEAEKARKKAIEIATEALGENDPETMLLKAAL